MHDGANICSFELITDEEPGTVNKMIFVAWPLKLNYNPLNFLYPYENIEINYSSLLYAGLHFSKGLSSGHDRHY
jgi:hypothetical protein